MRRFPAKSFLLSFRFPLLSCFPAWLPALLALLLFWLCGLVCLLGWVVVSFSLTDYETKEKAQRIDPCVLSCPVVGLLYSCVVIEELRRRCFGFFQFIRFVLPTNTTRVRRLASSYLDFLRHYVDITYNRPAFLK